MGMFDTIQDRLFCPFCGKQQKEQEFQSKDMANMLNVWTIEEIKKFCDKFSNIEIHTSCSYCHEWISINLELKRTKR